MKTWIAVAGALFIVLLALALVYAFWIHPTYVACSLKNPRRCSDGQLVQLLDDC